jgi:hypothetical protein
MICFSSITYYIFFIDQLRYGGGKVVEVKPVTTDRYGRASSAFLTLIYRNISFVDMSFFKQLKICKDRINLIIFYYIIFFFILIYFVTYWFLFLLKKKHTVFQIEIIVFIMKKVTPRGTLYYYNLT